MLLLSAASRGCRLQLLVTACCGCVLTAVEYCWLRLAQLLTEDEAREKKAKYGDGSFEIDMGAEAVKKLLGTLELVELSVTLRKELIETGSQQKKKELIASSQVEHVNSERKLLTTCSHPFLLRLIGAFQDRRSVFLILELIQGGELFMLHQSMRTFGLCGGVEHVSTPRCISLTSVQAASPMIGKSLN